MQSLANAGFRAIAPDLPGFGKTKGPALGTSIAEIAEHLVTFACALDIDHAGWIGHSIGCQAVLRIAALHPELASALVLSGPTGGSRHRLLHQVGALAVAAVQEPWRLMKAVLRDYIRISPLSYVGTWIKAADDDPLASAAAVRCPVLILLGARDRVPGKRFIAELSGKLEDSRVVRLPVGQHGLPVDAREHFDAAVIHFLLDVFGDGSDGSDRSD
jgi:pimeloyl-ACP methyl ester carboxylesterase